MKRIATAGAVASFVVVMVGNLIANAGPQVQTIRAISHTMNLGGVDADDSGEVGDTIADAFTSISDMRDEADETVIGFDRFTCSMTSAEPATWHCYGTTTFNGAGDITYQGSFNPNGKSVLAITGGTGDYEGAGGWVVFKPLSGDDFPYGGVYHVLP